MELVETSLDEIRQGVRGLGMVEDRLLLASETDSCEDIFAIQESLSLPWNLWEKGTTDPKTSSPVHQGRDVSQNGVESLVETSGCFPPRLQSAQAVRHFNQTSRAPHSKKQVVYHP